MILLDVDRFRRINSRHGHIVGDHVLSSIAAVLDSMVFRHDVVGRVDDDEFVVFMPVDQYEKFLQQRCRQIRYRLKTMELPGGAEISISLSTGGAICGRSPYPYPARRKPGRTGSCTCRPSRRWRPRC